MVTTDGTVRFASQHINSAHFVFLLTGFSFVNDYTTFAARTQHLGIVHLVNGIWSFCETCPNFPTFVVSKVVIWACGLISFLENLFSINPMPLKF